MRFSAFPVFLRYFNSQPHKEADWQQSRETTENINFNSQPHKEADWKRFYICKTLFHFNSQPHKEADEKDPD